MNKASAFFEMIRPWWDVYKGKAVVWVEMPSKLIEKHYYSMNEDGKILIFPENAKEGQFNPKILTQHRDVEADYKSYVYKWRYGEPFAVSLFGDEAIQKPIITDESTSNAFDLGVEWQKLLDAKKKNEESSMMLLLIGMVVLGVLVLATLSIELSIADKMGIKLFG